MGLVADFSLFRLRAALARDRVETNDYINNGDEESFGRIPPKYAYDSFSLV